MMASCIGAAVLAVAASRAEQQKEIPFADRPLEYRACPPDSEYKPTELAKGKVVVAIPSRFCYEEPARHFVYEETNDTAAITARVYYTEEGKVKRDAWSTRNGYHSIARQFIIIYKKESVIYELWFRSNPHADGRGLGDREGAEVMVFTREETGRQKDDGVDGIHDKERNEYVWAHSEYWGIHGEEENSWQSETLDHAVAKIMRFMRRRGYHAHQALREYSVEYNPERSQNPDPIVFTDNELRTLYAWTEKLYEKADKIEKREEKTARTVDSKVK